MARPLRIQYPGAFYHVTSRGNTPMPIFKSQADREKFLSYLKSAVLRYRAIIHAWCLMDNHYHLMMETIRHINVAYTTYLSVSKVFEEALPRGYGNPLQAVVASTILRGTEFVRNVSENHFDKLPAILFKVVFRIQRLKR